MQPAAGARPAMAFFPPGRTPRPEQRRAVEEIESRFASGSRVVAFQGPTGIGKSFIAASLFRKAAATGENAHIVTTQRVLQDQYATDFKPPEIEVMKGRSNYACTLEPWRPNAARGYCRSKERAALVQKCLEFGTVEEAMMFGVSPEAHKCPYWRQLATCVEAPVTLYNFQSFLFQQRLGRFGVRNLMILDEAHNTENVLLQFVQIVISSRALGLVGVELDLALKTPDQVVAWLDRERVESRIKETLGDAVETEDAAYGLSPEDTDRLRSLYQKIKDLRRFMGMTKWVVDVTEEGDEDERERTRKLRVRPVFVAPFAKELVFSKASRVLAMSATILNAGVWARNLGLSQASVAYVETPCPFPARNRPIILEYAGDMGWKNQPETLPRLYSTIERILERHRGQRGIVHGHSERLCRLILENVSSPRFVHLDQFKGRDKSALLKAHELRPDSVIVGSGFHEGIDLKDDLARFAILAKVPWPMMEDAFVKARIAEDKWFMAYQTALKLIQSSGRTVRCFDRETEILTVSGWKNADTLRIGDIAYGVDPKAFDKKSGRRPMRWGRLAVRPNPVVAINKPDTPENTVHIKTSAVDALVTPDHTMIVQAKKIRFHEARTRRNDKTYAWSRAYHARSQGLKRVPASELQERFKMPCGGWAVGRRGTRHQDEWFWLMGFIIGDGHFSRTKNLVELYQSTASSQALHVETLKTVLARLELKYRYYEESRTGTCCGYERNGAEGAWVITGHDSSKIRDMFHRGWIRRYSKKYAWSRRMRRGGVEGWKTPEKRIPRWVLNRAAPVQMLRLLEGMMAADGSAGNRSRRSKEHVNGCYWTSDRALADQLQELLSLCGFRSSMTVHRRAAEPRKEQLCVAFKNPATSDVVASVNMKNGPTVPVWCPSTVLGSVIARRKGKVFIAGNSANDWATSYMLDSGFEYFMKQAAWLLPKWFTEAIRRPAK